MTTPTLPPAVAAEVRHVTDGHNVRWNGERHVFLVRSDSTDLTREVTIASQGNLLRGTCTCPAGRHARHGVAVPCRHVAGVMHRLEREHVARWDGSAWVAAPALAEAAA